MGLEQFLANYGILAVFIGTFIEGETVCILAGFLAHRGYLSLPWMLVAAFAGTVASDQMYFQVGRRFGQRMLARRPKLRERVASAQQRFARHDTLFILVFRFIFGLRTVAPFAIGTTEVSAWRFTALNALGAAAWTLAFGLGGFAFGQALEALIGHIEHYEMTVMAVIAGAGLLVWLALLARRRHRAAAA